MHRKQVGRINSGSSAIIIPTLDIRIKWYKAIYLFCLPPHLTNFHPFLSCSVPQEVGLKCNVILRILLPSVFQLVWQWASAIIGSEGRRREENGCVLPNPSLPCCSSWEPAFLCGHSFCPSAWP